MYVPTLFIQDIWDDCIIPPEKYSAFNISNHYFSKNKIRKAIRLVLSDLVTNIDL